MYFHHEIKRICIKITKLLPNIIFVGEKARRTEVQFISEITRDNWGVVNHNRSGPPGAIFRSRSLYSSYR